MSETYEKYAAIRQGAQNHSSEEYFKARPQIDSGDRRRVFEAGFERAYDLRETEITALRSQVAELQKDVQVSKGQYQGACDIIKELQRQLDINSAALSKMKDVLKLSNDNNAELQRQQDEAARQEPFCYLHENGIKEPHLHFKKPLDGHYIPLWDRPINLPAIIEQARKEERESALKIMRHAAAALAHAAESNPMYQDAYNEIDAAIRARKP